jgi:hypothetical protein
MRVTKGDRNELIIKIHGIFLGSPWVVVCKPFDVGEARKWLDEIAWV